MQGSASLPELLCKFVGFLLEQLSKEEREARREALREAGAGGARARAEEAAREYDRLSTLLSGASVKPGGKKAPRCDLGDISRRIRSAPAALRWRRSPSAVISAMNLGDFPQGAKSETVDQIIARQYAAKMAKQQADESLAAAEAAAEADAGNEATMPPPVLESVFESTWSEMSRFPGVTGAKPTCREARSLVTTLVLDGRTAQGVRDCVSSGPAPPSPSLYVHQQLSAHTIGNAPSFLEALEDSVCRVSSTRGWCVTFLIWKPPS